MKHRFERYCKEYENIENYEAAKKDNFKGWGCHHRLETHNSDRDRRLVDITPAELKALGMYYNRPASELVFLTISEHRSLHNSGSGNPMCNEDTRKKVSETTKGKYAGENNAMYGKHHTEESKKKMSETRKGIYKCYHWYNNGKINRFCKECPPGFVPGMLKRK